MGLFYKPVASSPIQPTLAYSLTIASQTPTLIPATSTQTPTATLSVTQTPTIVSTTTFEMPTPTFTPLPPAIGMDWASGCISSLWIPFPPNRSATFKNGCFSQPVGLFKTNNGNLSFEYQGNVSSAEIQGLFAQLPSGGSVSIGVTLTHLTKGEIWLGIFSKPDIQSPGIVLVVPEGDIMNRVIVEKAMPDERKIVGTQSIHSDKAVYTMTFDVSNQLVKARSKNARFNFYDFPLDSEQKWLFIGFKTLNGFSRITADFHNLEVRKQ